MGEPVDLEEEDAGDVRPVDGRTAPRDWALTTFRYQLSSSSIASSDDVADVAIVSAIVTTIASARPVISAPGTRSIAKATRIALMHDRRERRA